MDILLIDMNLVFWMSCHVSLSYFRYGNMKLSVPLPGPLKYCLSGSFWTLALLIKLFSSKPSSVIRNFPLSETVLGNKLLPITYYSAWRLCGLHAARHLSLLIWSSSQHVLICTVNGKSPPRALRWRPLVYVALHQGIRSFWLPDVWPCPGSKVVLPM